MTATAALAVALVAAGCSEHEVLQPTVSVSVGQQLIDLKKARDSGAVTERDYQRQKEQLIDSVK
jgi:hypothetical protein